MQADRPRLILASASAARRALLAAAGLLVDIRPAAIDEAVVKRSARADGASPDEVALRLAELKARRIDDPDALVIGADQLLVCDGAWFDKPSDLAAARAQLRALRGRSHTLHTAIVCCSAGKAVWHHIARPTLAMRPFSDAFLDAYLETEAAHVTGTVGAYRLEGPGLQLFDRVEGEYAAILGMPLLPLLGFLRQRGVLSS